MEEILPLVITVKNCIFIPAYNCEKEITHVLDEIPQTIWKNSTVLVVDDCSKDNTSGVVLDYKKKKKMKNLVLITNKKNRGYGGVQKVAYNYAIAKGYDVVFMVHGDWQHPAGKIPDVLRLMNKNCALAYGSRISGDPLGGGMPFYKFLGSHALTFVENVFLGTRISEFHSGFRAYNCSFLKQVNFEKLTDGYFFDTDIIILFAEKKWLIRETPIPTLYGPNHGGRGIPFTKAVKYGYGIMKALFEYKLHHWGLKYSYKYDVNT